MATARAERPLGSRPWDISAVVNIEVVEQHAENAAFLWCARNRAVRAPHYYLEDLVRTDERVEADIDGLRVAGSSGWELAAQALDMAGPGELFAAAVLAFESNDSEWIDAVLKIGTSDSALQNALVSALAWVRFDHAKPVLEALLHSKNAVDRRIAIAAYAAYRVDPGEPLRQAAADSDPLVQSRAFKAAGQLGRTDLAHTIVRFISSSDESCRFYCAWASARLGIRDRDVLDTLRSIADAGDAHAEPALQIALRCVRLDEAHAWLSAMLHDPTRLRSGITGIGIVGDPARMSELIGYMQVETLSRVAGEAFSIITGVDLKNVDLDRPQPEGFEAGPTDEPADENVAMDADEDLAWPSPDLVRNWWDKHEGEYQHGVRYLRGAPIDPAALTDALKNGYQRQRAAAALELGLLRPTDPMFAIRTRGRWQARTLNGA